MVTSKLDQRRSKRLSTEALTAISNSIIAGHSWKFAPILKYFRTGPLPTFQYQAPQQHRPRKHKVRVALRHSKARVVGGRFALHEKAILRRLQERSMNRILNNII